MAGWINSWEREWKIKGSSVAQNISHGWEELSQKKEPVLWEKWWIRFRSMFRITVMKYDIQMELFRRLLETMWAHKTSGDSGGRSTVRDGHRFGDCEAVDVWLRSQRESIKQNNWRPRLIIWLEPIGKDVEPGKEKEWPKLTSHRQESAS